MGTFLTSFGIFSDFQSGNPVSTTVCYCYAQEPGEFRVSAGTNRKVLLVDDLDFTAHSSGIPLLGNLPLDWGFQEKFGHVKYLGIF